MKKSKKKPAKVKQIIGVELQAHGRTNDRNTDLTFERDADDIAGLLANLNIGKADFLGFSNGGHTAMEIAIRHPELKGRRKFLRMEEKTFRSNTSGLRLF